MGAAAIIGATGALLGGGAAVYGAATAGGGGSAADAAARAAGYQSAAAQQAADLSWKMYMQTREDLAPWRGTGTAATTQEAGMLGLPGYNALDPTSILRATPGYQWAVGQGVNALDRSAASKGMLMSGAQTKALTTFGQGLADQTYQQYINNLARTSALGESAAAQTGGFGMQAANQMGQSYMAGGQAQAQGVYNAYNARQSAYQNQMQNAFGMGGMGMYGLTRAIPGVMNYLNQPGGTYPNWSPTLAGYDMQDYSLNPGQYYGY